MSLLKYWPLALIAFSGATGGFALHQWKERLRAEGRAEVHRVAAVAAKAVADSALEAKALSDSLRALDIARADSTARAEAAAREEARRRAADAQRRADNALEAAEEAVEGNAEAEAALAEVRQAHADERAEWQETERTYRAELFAVRQSRDSWQEMAEEANGALLAVQAALAASERVNRVDTSPGFVERWGGRIVAVGVGVATGYVLASR